MIALRNVCVPVGEQMDKNKQNKEVLTEREKKKERAYVLYYNIPFLSM